MKLINRLEQIDLSKDDCAWGIYSQFENEQFLEKIGILTEVVKKVEGQEISTGENLIVNKTVLIKKDEEKLYVFKRNLYTPHGHKAINRGEDKLDIPCAMGEYIWTKYASILNISNIVPAKLCHLVMNGKKTVCSYTKLQEEYYPVYKFEKYYPEVFAQLKADGKIEQPINLKLFLTFIGRGLKRNDILFNTEGDFKIIDLGDANHTYIDAQLDKLYKYFEKFDNVTQIKHLTEGVSMLNQLIKHKDAIVSDVYSLYNKTNLTYNQQLKRKSGLDVYENKWFEIADVFKHKITELQTGSSEEIPETDEQSAHLIS